MPKKQNKRMLSYDLAINEALFQMMEKNPSVIVLGQGVKSPWYVGRTTKDLYDTFSKTRVIDTPVSENAMTGVAAGAALAGLIPVIIHPRLDFMVYAMEQVVNEIANWHYMFGGALSIPMVIRPIINRGGEQAAQHSQALHVWFAHVPGLKVVMPASAYDAKGLLISALRDPNPVIYIDDRWLYSEQEYVPETLYEIPFGKARIRKKGADITIVAVSYMVKEALDAADHLKEIGIDAEVIDPRTLRPLDTATILRSIKKTGKLIVADCGWKSFGVSAEIVALAAEKAYGSLKAPTSRIALPECPSPASKPLETAYYPGKNEIIACAKKLMKQ